MGAKVKVKINKRQIAQIQKRAKKILPGLIKSKVSVSISKGISPVKGFRKFKKYSESYKDAIRGRTAFFTVNSEVRVVSAKGVKGKTRKRNKEFIKNQNKALSKKRISPVNLRVSGELLRSLFAKASGKGIVVGFNNELADIHNRLGPGGNKNAVRRLLPTKPNEEFNKSITLSIKRTLKKIINNIF